MLMVISRPTSLTLLSVSHGIPHVPHRNMTHVAPLHGGINILLGGAMMGGMLVVVFCICYCCHKRVQKTEFQEEGSDQWLQSSDDSDSNLQVFTLEGQQCYEVEGVFIEEPSPHPSPPPSYHDVMAESQEKEKADPELPSYEAALRLQGLQRHNQDYCTIYMDQLTYI